MPIYIYQEDAFDRMVQVEGEEYRACGTKETFGDVSFEAFREEWEKHYAARWKGTSVSHPCIRVNGNPCIYGWHGFDRYAVGFNGEIIFIREQAAGREFVRKAQEVGFALDTEAFFRAEVTT